MNRTKLTYEDALLLQRHFDGQADQAEEEAAQALLAERPSAKVYLALLDELRQGVQVAIGDICERANFPDPAQWIEQALNGAAFIEQDLSELAPLLERFHDEEVDEAEAAVVLAMSEQRQDVAAYLDELAGISTSIRQAQEMAQVDLSNFWSELEKKLDESGDSTLFKHQEHGVLLHRYHDGEVSAEEDALVQSWLDGGDREVDGFLGALAELHLGVNAAIETAQEEAPLHEIWTAVEAQIDDKQQVISLEDRRAEKREKNPFWQRPLFAAAAAVLLLVLGGVLGPRLMAPEQIIEKRTVVIFDSVEYSPGSSVMIHSPRLASHEADEDEIPILWVLDDEEDEESKEGQDPASRQDFIPGPI